MCVEEYWDDPPPTPKILTNNNKPNKSPSLNSGPNISTVSTTSNPLEIPSTRKSMPQEKETVPISSATDSKKIESVEKSNLNVAATAFVPSKVPLKENSMYVTKGNDCVASMMAESVSLLDGADENGLNRVDHFRIELNDCFNTILLSKTNHPLQEVSEELVQVLLLLERKEDLLACFGMLIGESVNVVVNELKIEVCIFDVVRLIVNVWQGLVLNLPACSLAVQDTLLTTLEQYFVTFDKKLEKDLSTDERQSICRFAEFLGELFERFTIGSSPVLIFGQGFVQILCHMLTVRPFLVSVCELVTTYQTMLLEYCDEVNLDRVWESFAPYYCCSNVGKSEAVAIADVMNTVRHKHVLSKAEPTNH